MNNNQFDSNDWNWFQYLKSPQDIKDEYYDQACHLAGTWTTCACGHLCKELPKVKDLNVKVSGMEKEAPADKDLRVLGLEFAANIQDEHYNYAFDTLMKIEQRTIKLLSDARNNPKQ